ncbi:hypothetical protein P879_10860 [Paragonimus westermani]|uniref:Uncharacterized protein n=1 Tax=Paragonimus westermani TaxID=34504 RepID=A0A8T0D9P4_9TREM|nr:hypothetical protein P879_10860 [Paragonimus westermani]
MDRRIRRQLNSFVCNRYRRVSPRSTTFVVVQVIARYPYLARKDPIRESPIDCRFSFYSPVSCQTGLQMALLPAAQEHRMLRSKTIDIAESLRSWFLRTSLNGRVQDAIECVASSSSKLAEGSTNIVGVTTIGRTVTC